MTWVRFVDKRELDIHTAEDWDTIFLLLKTAGAGLVLEKKVDEAEAVPDPARPLQNSRAASENDLSQSGVSDTESEGGNVSDRGYTSDNDTVPEGANINMVRDHFRPLPHHFRFVS